MCRKIIRDRLCLIKTRIQRESKLVLLFRLQFKHVPVIEKKKIGEKEKREEERNSNAKSPVRRPTNTPELRVFISVLAS